MDPELIVLQLEVWALEIAVTKVGGIFAGNNGSLCVFL